MSLSSYNWCRHLMPEVAKVNAGMIIPFNSRQPSHYAQMVQKIFTSTERNDGASNGPTNRTSAPGTVTAVSADEGAAAAGGGGGASNGGGAGGDGDAEGDGDGDSDGPRRKPACHRKSSRVSAVRRRSPSPSKSSAERMHSRALLTLTIVITLVLGTVVCLGLNGQPVSAEKVLDALNPIATITSAFVRPK